MSASFPSVESRLARVATTHIPTRYADFTAHAYHDDLTGDEHVALVLGDLGTEEAGCGDGMAGHRQDQLPLVRLHSECLTGDALGSRRCDCRDQLDAALAAIATQGRGAVVYLRGHEGRGIGLAAKLRAYALQDGGLDTLDANLALGLPVDSRDYEIAAAILTDLGATGVRLLSSNPEKETALRRHGIEVVRVGLQVTPRVENLRYLRTKHHRLGHDAVVADPGWRELLEGSVVPVGELAARYGPLVTAGPRLVVGQLGQSVDGFIASRTGEARFVTGPEDRVHLHRLRALVDAVVVGVTTVSTDNCRLTVRSVAGPNPVRVVLDPNARAPRAAHVLTVCDAPTLWVVGADWAPEPPASHVRVVRLRRRRVDGAFSPRDVLEELAVRGLGRVLIEGGGVTVSRFVHAGALDRLMVTTSPILIGDGVPGLRFDGHDRLADAIRAPSRRFPLGDDVCIELDLGAARIDVPAGTDRCAKGRARLPSVSREWAS